MAAGFPVKADYVTGDVLSAANMNDLAGTLNYLDPTAKGDLFPASSGTALARLAVGANGQVLTADSTTATGLKWAAAAGGGKVLQVVNATTTTTTTVSSTTYTDTGLSATITPSATTSKVLVIYNQALSAERSAIATAAKLQLVRGSTSIQDVGFALNINVAGTTFIALDEMVASTCLDSPNTTSATTYKTQIAVNTTANGGTSRSGNNGSLSSITLIEIGA